MIAYAAGVTLLLVTGGWFASRNMRTSSAATPAISPSRDSVAVPAAPPAAPRIVTPAAVRTGKLRLLTIPPSAEILVDGRRVGVGSVVDLRVPSGSRRLRVQAAGYTPWDTIIVVETGVTHSLGRVTLRAPGE
jgi:hypothetical protein